MLNAFEFAMEMVEMVLVNEFGNTPKGQQMLTRVSRRAEAKMRDATPMLNREDREMQSRYYRGKGYDTPVANAHNRRRAALQRYYNKADFTRMRALKRMTPDNWASHVLGK